MIIKNILGDDNQDKTFVTPNTTFEVTDNSGNKKYVKYSDLSDDEKTAVKNRGGNSTGVVPGGKTDMGLVGAVNTTVSDYTPTIKIKNDGSGLILSGTKTALQSDLAKELRTYLSDTFKYQNLQSENTAKIIGELNDDIKSQIERSVVENGAGMDYDSYKDYAHAVDVMRSTNPMKKTGDKNKIAGYDKDGKIAYKTPQEWVDYYRKEYNSTDRAALFTGASLLMSQAGDSSPMDPALWTPYLVMSGGENGDRPLYGFDTWEKFQAGATEFMNEASAKLIEGIDKGVLRATSFVLDADGYRRRNHLNDIAKGLGRGDVTSEEVPWISEEEYNKKINSIIGKKYDDLTDEERAFIATTLSDGFIDGDERSVKVFVVNKDGVVDDNFLQAASYDNYINARDNLSSVEKYDKEIDKKEDTLSKGHAWLQNKIDTASVYAPVSVGAGRFTGTMARFLAESYAIQGLTGGSIALNQIGDDTLAKITTLAIKGSKLGVPTASTIVKAFNSPLGHFLASVVTEIPEDIVQTAVDNVLTGNAEENKTLLTPDSIAQNTLQNLVMRAAFSVVGAGVNTVRYRNALKKAQRDSGLAKTVNIDGLFDDADSLKAAADSGRVTGVTSDGKFKIVGDDDVERVLDNTYVLSFRDMEDYPLLQEIARRYQPEGAEISFDAIDNAKKAVESGDYISDVEVSIVKRDELVNSLYDKITPKYIADNYVYDSIIESKVPKETQYAWYIGDGKNYDYDAKKAMFSAAAGDPELRNAALNKMFNEWKLLNKGNENLRYEDWLNTEITLYRGHAKGDTDEDLLSYTLNKEVAKQHGDVVDEIKIRPIDTTGIIKSNWLADGIETEGEVFIPRQLAREYYAYIVHKNNGDVDLYRGQPYSRDESFVYNNPSLVGDGADLVTDALTNPTGKNHFGDAYFFTTHKPWAMEFGDSLVKWTVKESNMLSIDDFYALYRQAEELAADADKMAEYVAKNGPEKGEQMSRLSAYDFRAAAELSGKPVIMATEGKIGPEWLYYKGVDEDFDKHAYTQLLASTTMDAPDADAANILMANQIQKAIDTQPYGKTPAEIIADKYINSGPISDAPNSASIKWEVPDVDGVYQDMRHAMADQPTNLTMDQVKEWYGKTLNTARKYYTDNIAPVFNERYPTATDQQTFVRNMHYLFDLQKFDGLTLEQSIGKTLVDIDGTELKVTQEDVDFYNEVLTPYMKELREYSVAGLGRSVKAGENAAVVGYLPHTSYDPMDMTSEEALHQGNLWKKYSGASASTEDGNFTTTTLSSDLAEEFDIFAKNMIWDSLGDKAIVAKYMSELHADGVDTKAENVQKMIDSSKKIADATTKSGSAKKVTKYLTGKDSTFDWKAFNDEVSENAKKVGATKALNVAYSPVYGQTKGSYYKNPSIISLQQTSDVMRGIATPDGDMYSNGGRMVVAGAADAGYMAKRIFDQANDGRIDAKNIKQMFVDYLTQDGKRTARGAEYIADQWMRKIAKDVGKTGNISRRALTSRLNSLIYFEGSSRLKRWVGRADISKFNAKTVSWMDDFFFRQGVLSRHLNSSDIMAKVNKSINSLISARMKSLFWLNFKNGVLQASECVRIFTEFEMGDALKTIGRLASDKTFSSNVDEWVDLLIPERNFSKVAEATDVLDVIAKKSEIVDGDISVGKLSAAEEDSLFKKIDEAAMTPIDMGENLKNRVLIAGILQEAERKGLDGDALFNFVNKKFERIGLANNELGRLAGADNPAFRIATNLKSFSVRQFGMYINNIKDMNGGEAVGYIIKNLGWKLGLAVILAKLGYSVPQSLGIDPFDILDDDYTGVDEDNYNALDKVIAGPAGRALLSGGFTSYLADLYWASRQAYEKQIATPAEDVDRKFADRGIFELAMPNVSFDNMLNFGAGFIPGYTQGKRVIDMAELQAGGWAISATGNKMYAAPDNAFDTATGYIFGRGNTPNARTYYQTADPLQGLIEGGIQGFNQQFFGRGFNLGGGYRNFDPVDSQNYSDWFYGDSRDDQQWNAGYYYFRQRAQQLQNEYQKALQNSYDESSRSAAYESYNAQLRELDDSISRFAKAYQDKNGGKFDANKMNNILTVMRTYQPDLSADELERTQQFFDADNAALQRYVAAGLPRVISYEYSVNKEKPEESKTVVKYSPQVRAAMEGRYGLPKEASRLIKQVYNDKWKELNKEYRDKYYSTRNSKEKKAIQADFFRLVRKDLDPIVALYGAEIFSNDDVDDVMEDVFNSMTPYGTSVKKYLQGKYENYMSGTIQYSQPGNETITEIRSLLDQGKTARGKALARTLLQRVKENRQALTRSELEWLQGVLND